MGSTLYILSTLSDHNPVALHNRFFGLIQEAPYSLTFPRYRHVSPPKSFYIFAY